MCLLLTTWPRKELDYNFFELKIKSMCLLIHIKMLNKIFMCNYDIHNL